MSGTFFDLTKNDIVLDELPDHVAASVEVRNAYLNDLAAGGALGLEFVLDDLRKWLPGQAVRVAFLGGDADLHRDVADATAEITDACSIVLDFGETAEGTFRAWSEADADHVAEIRISFDKKGYFSLVGTDSIDDSIGSPLEKVGGRPGQASMNFGGFAVQKPASWRGTVRHEFLHALGFHHAHQNMRGPCQAAFRWEDDPGYSPTKDAHGTFVPDANGRRPGIYTYLAGFPNFWGRSKVDHNLKTEEDPSVVVGPFDADSCMLYRFPDHFYRSLPSPCAPAGDGQSLSAGDKRGLQLLYPHMVAETDEAAATNGAVAADEAADRQRSILAAIEPAVPGPAAGTAESERTGGSSPILAHVAAILRRKLAAQG